MNFILQTPTGFVVAGKSTNFPKLAELQDFIDLRPVAVAEGMRVKVVGRVGVHQDYLAVKK